VDRHSRGDLPCAVTDLQDFLAIEFETGVETRISPDITASRLNQDRDRKDSFV
jgi:hypothetical protein